MENGGGEGGKNSDFYQVLGLNKDCTATELRNAYKKLALRWHPDRFPASGNSKFVDEAKKKFQAIQQAYSVLSDTNKRFLYDVGVYDSDDDENGMGGFMNEMAAMMSQTKPRWLSKSAICFNARNVLNLSSSPGTASVENVEESFEELQELFDEMFQADLDSFGIGCQATTCVPYSESTNSNNKRVSADMNLGKTKVDHSSGFISHQVEKFCLGVEHQQSFKKGKGVRGGVRGGTGGRGREAGQDKKSFIWL
ncbi:hypothetical protein OIU77_023511 [Salix suchowensis]|uniref:J domain-containing protein n=1 Tax=Salix suchowensis TaxID=1278906 RepID=A0ABQ9C776_9ROSI|nr:hypothetical protein OIU77_023511 [Salix suchowensis]